MLGRYHPLWSQWLGRHIESQILSQQWCLRRQRFLRPTTRLFSRDLQVTDTRTPSLWNESFSIDTPDGSPPAEIMINRSPDTLQTEWSATSTEMAGGSPPAHIDICDGPDSLQTDLSVTTTTMSGGSPPAEIGNSRTPDRLQKDISVTSSEMAGGSPPAHIDICESPDRLKKEISVTSTEKAGGNPLADTDNCESPELLQRVGSVTAVVSEKWMERFVIKPKVMCSDDSASDDHAAGRSSDASRIASVQNQIPTLVCVQTVVFPVVFAGGGGVVADAYPLVVVESDTVQVSGLQLVESAAAQVSVLPVAGWKFPAVFFWEGRL